MRDPNPGAPKRIPEPCPRCEGAGGDCPICRGAGQIVRIVPRKT